jgi:phage gp29-like protein
MPDTLPNDPNPMQNGLTPKQRPRKPLPAPMNRGPDVPLATSVEVQRSFFTTADKLLRNSSLAYRLNPQYQMMMRSDADIEGVLRSLQVTLASLEWAVVPAVEDDPRLDRLAERITKIFESMPRRSDFVRAMHEAVWYGNSACNFVYERDERLGVAIREWYPFHPDTLAYDQRGNLAMRVGSAYSSDGPSAQNIGFDSRVHIFDDRERQSVILHRVFVAAPDFNDPNSSESIYRGVGARDVCWFMWLAKQEILQDAITYAERYAMGIRVGYYPLGQDAGQAMMETVLANLTNDNSVLLPQSGTEKIYDIDIKEPNAGRAQIFLELVNWFSSKIKEAILGQSLSSEAAGTGLGSGVASLHADTLSRIIRYHADALADSMTTDFVRVVAKMLGASDGEAAALRFQFAPERPDPKERLEAIEKFVQMGGRVSENEVRDLLGLSLPTEDEQILGASPRPANSGPPLTRNEGDPLSLQEWLATESETAGQQPSEGTEPQPDSPRTFSRRTWW